MRNSDGNEYSFKGALHEQHMGSLFSCFKKKKTVFDKGGPGLSLYFNFLKSTILFFTICALMTIPLHVYNIRMYRLSENPNLKPSDDNIWSRLIASLAATTLGVANISPNSLILGSLLFQLKKL